MKNHKAKGSKGERELVKFFNESGWNCIRAAGSGSSQRSAGSVLCGAAGRLPVHRMPGPVVPAWRSPVTCRPRLATRPAGIRPVV